MDDQRKFTRITFAAKASLICADERWKVELIDISLHGVLIQCVCLETLMTGSAVTVLVDLAGEENSIEMHGKVTYIHADHVGVVCEHMDVDSISELRRIVELNLGDDKLLQREISALVDSSATTGV